MSHGYYVHAGDRNQQLRVIPLLISGKQAPSRAKSKEPCEGLDCLSNGSAAVAIAFFFDILFIRQRHTRRQNKRIVTEAIVIREAHARPRGCDEQRAEMRRGQESVDRRLESIHFQFASFLLATQRYRR